VHQRRPCNADVQERWTGGEGVPSQYGQDFARAALVPKRETVYSIVRCTLALTMDGYYLELGCAARGCRHFAHVSKRKIV
jgi:hypothetical protein